jgi:hypothetical protein
MLHQLQAILIIIFIFVQLYVDDKTLLPLKDQYEMNIDHTNKKRKIRTIGDLNISLLKKYPHSSHPSLFITNKMDSVVALINYNPNSEELINEFNLALNGLNLKN